MKFQSPLSFLLVSLLAGLCAALLVLKLQPDPGGAPAHFLGPGAGPASYAAAVERAAPAVVNIYTTKVAVEHRASLLEDPLFQFLFGDRLAPRQRKRLETSLGSGVVVDGRGLILTNHHVIAGADEIQAVLSDGRSLQAEILGSDPESDLALLRTAEDDLPAIGIGDSEALRVGDVVLAIGNPFGVGQTVTMGIVSATGRSRLGINAYENFIQTDAAINPGNSGGALINARGELVGINTAIFSKSGGSMGIGFAIPVSLAHGVMEQLLDQGRVIRGWLGIAGQDITPALARSFELQETHGVLISAVLEDGPADRAGIQPGDVITRIGEQEPRNVQEVLAIISRLIPGSTVEIQGWRGSKPFTTEAAIIERPRPKGE
jgi:serine protease DegS